MRYIIIGMAVFVILMIFVLIIYFKDKNSRLNGAKYDEETGKFYPVLNGDEDTANVLVTLPDGSKGWTGGLGNGYIR